MPDETNDQEKKIFVDEDWKSKVQAEKEAASQAPESDPCAQAETPADAAEAPADAAGPLPPPNLTFLASSLYLQGMVSLGLLPGPTSDKPQVNLPQAKHAIDTLQMLQEKTEGNRTEDESQEIETMLHELRLSYVAVQQQGGKVE